MSPSPFGSGCAARPTDGLIVEASEEKKPNLPEETLRNLVHIDNCGSSKLIFFLLYNPIHLFTLEV
jgi:hypothetical protein